MKYRKNVCIVIKKPNTKKFLLCHRKGFSKDEGWQFPQGGIRKNKNLILETKRELKEEIGTSKIKIIKISKKEYKYIFPKGVNCKYKNFKGQSQKWVLAEFLGRDKDINFSNQPQEFDNFKWVTIKTVLKKIVSFKKDVYKKALTDLGILKIFNNKISG